MTSPCPRAHQVPLLLTAAFFSWMAIGCSDSADQAQDSAAPADLGPDLPAPHDGGQLVDQAPALDSSSADLGPDQGPDLTPNSFGAPLAAELSYGGQMIVDGTLSGAPAKLALDTGAAPTAVDLTYASGLFAAVDIAFGPIDLPGQGVASTDLSLASAFVGVPLGALIGSDILGSWYLGLDYRTPAVYLQPTPFSGLPPGGSGAPLPASITSIFGIPVVEGVVGSGALEVPLRLIADTGSGVTLITQSIFEQIDPQGALPRLQGYLWYTSSGSTPGFVTRLPRLRIGQAEVAGSWAVVVPDNHHMAGTLGLVGLPPSFLGFPFYREFLTAYAGPEQRYLFYPGAGTTLPDEWRRVGVELSQRAEGFRIEWVYQPSDAATQGLTSGDLLLAVDGVPTAGRSLGQVVALISGSPGTQLSLQLRRGSATFETQVLIEELLPSL